MDRLEHPVGKLAHRFLVRIPRAGAVEVTEHTPDGQRFRNNDFRPSIRVERSSIVLDELGIEHREGGRSVAFAIGNPLLRRLLIGRQDDVVSARREHLVVGRQELPTEVDEDDHESLAEIRDRAADRLGERFPKLALLANLLGGRGVGVVHPRAFSVGASPEEKDIGGHLRPELYIQLIQED